MIDAVVLCGGQGSRLASVFPDRPKALAPVENRPFLEWLLLALMAEGLTRAVLATGRLGEQIEAAFGDGHQLGLQLRYSRESHPLGTAGALRLAASKAEGERLLVLNGDSYCRFDLSGMRSLHQERHARATLWLAAAADAERYGGVELDGHGAIVHFAEKGHDSGLISSGVYLIERSLIEELPSGQELSLEHDVFPSLAGHGLYGMAGTGVFVDIGTPESWRQADNLLHEELRRVQETSSEVRLGRAFLDRSLVVQQQAFQQCLPQVVEAARAAAASLREGGKILLCGNGGSAADCQHIATELVCRLSREIDRPALPALSLATDTSVLTAFGNDSGFDGVFARQVEAHGRRGDVLIAISTSGGSPNVLGAAEAARRIGMTIIALCGDAGRLKDDADYAVVVPDRDTQHIQEALLPLEHLFCSLIEQSLFGAPPPA